MPGEILHIKLCVLLSVCVCRCCGVRAAPHLQSLGPPGRPDSLRASGSAGGRHAHCPRGSVSGEIFIILEKKEVIFTLHIS